MPVEKEVRPTVEPKCKFTLEKQSGRESQCILNERKILIVYYSVQMLSFYLKIWIQVDKPFRYRQMKYLGNPLCVLGYRSNYHKISTTVHNYLKMKFCSETLVYLYSEQLFSVGQAFFLTHLGFYFLLISQSPK